MFLEIKEVSKFYSNHTALDRVSFDIPRQSIFGLLGPNGAGKTSLIRIINQITQPDTGEVIFDGEKLAPEHINRIGYLPEERGLYTKMKVWDQMMYFAQLRRMNRKEAEARCIQLMTRFEIADWKNKKVEELSKGMQQKVQFIITIMHQPDLIILDEPFTGFDPINTQLIKDEIIRLKDEGATVIFSTHRMESVEEICDSVGMINLSKKVLEGSVQQVKRDHEIGVYEIISNSDVSTELKVLEGERLPDGRYRYLIPANENPQTRVSEWAQKDWFSSFSKQSPSIHDIFIQLVQKHV
jgi:ABC-2 type transport system ATP-binding protein